MNLEIQTSLAVIRDYGFQNEKGFPTREISEKASDLHRHHYKKVFAYVWSLEHPNQPVPDLDKCGIYSNAYYEIGVRIYNLYWNVRY